MNQCDGCLRGLPIRDGIHYGPSEWDRIGCTAHLYKEKEEDHEQGTKVSHRRTERSPTSAR